MRRAHAELRRLATLVACALLVACGDDDAPEPAWHDLTLGFEPDLAGAVALDLGGPRLELHEHAGGLEARIHYSAEDWNPTPVPGLFVTDLAVPRSFVEGERATLHELRPLDADGRRGEPFGYARSIDAGTDWTKIPPGSFGTEGHLVGLFLEAGAAPPADAVHAVPLPLGAPDGDGWRLATNRWSGAGFLVPTGLPQRIDLEAEWTRESTELHLTLFALTAFAALDDAPPRFEVRVDGAVALEHELDAALAATDGAALRTTLEVPAGARTVEVRCDGPLGLTGVLEPVLAPSGARARRDADARPDLVLFVADTLRADALERRRVWRDSHDLDLPHLAELTAASAEFDRAWSTSTWTLPAHASMLTGLMPANHGAVGEFTRLSGDATTLAEVLAADGYRTVAVTDGIYVSAEYGLDQGFASFDQTHGPRADPLSRAKAALANGDGRPTFLFVHTYVAHTPYDPSAEALAAVGIEAAIEWAELERDLAARIDERDANGTLGQLADDALVAFARDVYSAAVLDFDRELGAFLEAFDDHGWRDRSLLAFTSDHGEAFGDHGQMFHGGELYETQTRVPLLLSGRGVEAGLRTDVASIIDLPRTFAAATGVAADASWRGRSLLTEPTGGAYERPAAWMSIRAGERVQLGFALDRYKRIELVGEDASAVYDLVRDPDELAPLERFSTGLRPWFERYDAGRAGALEAVLEPERLTNPSAELLERLRAMGYLDD